MLHLRKPVFQLCCVALFAVALVCAPSAQTAFSASELTKPVPDISRQAVQPWRIALIAGGPFNEYQIILQGLAERLAELGIIADGAVPLPEDDESLAPMWKWLAENAGGDTLRFVADAFYSPEWNPDRRSEVKEELLKRLHDQGDIDCVLAFGTWSGQDMGREPLQIPVLIPGAANAVEAEIIPSPEDSGRDNLLAVIQPDRFMRQVQVFHEFIGFSKLGITYEDTYSGRISIAMGEIEAAAKEAGVELLRCIDVTLVDLEGTERAASRLRACHEELVKQGAEAVYITYNLQGLDGRYAIDALEPLIEAGLPTFAQQGSDLVRRGALLSMANNNIKGEGFFVAEALEKILKGSLPRSLPQRYESTISLAVNLRTAARIGWNLPMEILAAVDEFYRDF